MTSTRHLVQITLVLALLIGGLLAAPAALAEGDTGSISGVVFQDWDQDGERDDEEPSLAGARLVLYSHLGEELVSVETELDGAYHLEGLAPGTYILVEQDPLGYSSLTDNKVELDVQAGETTEHHFGDVLLLLGPSVKQGLIQRVMDSNLF